MKLGADIAGELLDKGAGEILSSVYNAAQLKQEENETLKKELIAEVKRAPDTADTLEIDKDKDLVILTRQTRYLGNMPTILERLDYQPIHLSLIHI